MRKVFHKWTSKRFWFLPLPYGAHKGQKNVLQGDKKVFGTILKRMELVLGTELLEG